MTAETDYSPLRTSVDRQACAAYLEEMAKMLGREAMLSIVDEAGLVIMQRDTEDLPHSLVLLAEKIAKPPSKAVRQRLGTSCFEFYLPLPRVEGAPLALRVLIEGGVAPSLGDLKDLIGLEAECLARQINIDTQLSATASLRRPTAYPSSIMAQINAYKHAGSLETSIERLAHLCHTGLGCYAVMVCEFDSGLQVSSPRQAELKVRTSDVVKRLKPRLLEKGKILSARFSLPNGNRSRLICAPIRDAGRQVIGMTVLLGAEKDEQHSKIARALSSKVSAIFCMNSDSGELIERGALVETGNEWMREHTGNPCSVVYFDADNMHAINDAFGYSGGDNALEILADIMLEQAGEIARVAHIESDRYAMFIEDANSESASDVAERIVQLASKRSIDDQEKSISLSISAGIASSAEETRDTENLLMAAEIACRAAKERGGNQVAVHHDLDVSLIQRRSDVDRIGFLQMALIENKFVLHAQRIASTTPAFRDKFELLTRLSDDLSQKRMGGDIFSAAERYHFMAALDRWVVNSALHSIAATNNTVQVNLATFCINVSAQSLCDDAFIDHIEAMIIETGVAPDMLCFEITETALVRHIARAQRFVHRMQRLGCQVALDDFGTGYSSFSYLKNLPINFLKIDGAFIRDIKDSPLSRAIVESVVKIGNVLGARTVAEQVENEETHHVLRDIGVDFVQGFVIHRPENLEHVLSNLRVASESELDIDQLELVEYDTAIGNIR